MLAMYSLSELDPCRSERMGKGCLRRFVTLVSGCCGHQLSQGRAGIQGNWLTPVLCLAHPLYVAQRSCPLHVESLFTSAFEFLTMNRQAPPPSTTTSPQGRLLGDRVKPFGGEAHAAGEQR